MSNWELYFNEFGDEATFRRVSNKIEMRIIKYQKEPFEDLPCPSPDSYVPNGLTLDASKRSFLNVQVRHTDEYVNICFITGELLTDPFWMRRILINPQVVLGWETK